MKHNFIFWGILRQLMAGFPRRRPGFYPTSGHMGFIVGKVALWQDFTEYFGFPCQFSFHQIPQNSSIIRGWYSSAD
jgi:hypothetical protein